MEVNLPGARHPFIHVHSGSSADRWSNRTVNRFIEDILRSVCADRSKHWSSVVAFALNDSVHDSTCYTPFYVNVLTHPRVPLTLPRDGSGLDGGEVADLLADVSPASVKKLVNELFATRLNVLRYLCDEMADSQDRQQ